MRHYKRTDRTVKQLIWKLILPLTIISFATCTKWWYVLPVDAPDTMLTGFPFPFVGPGWHTSMSLQIFMTEFIIDILVYFAFCFLLIYCIDRYLRRIKVSKPLAIILLTFSGLIVTGTLFIASDSTNIFNVKRPWKMDVMTTGYKFTWQHQERPDFNKYDPRKK